jgi:cyclopropane-fatty-acyl-phospholipid synthase
MINRLAKSIFLSALPRIQGGSLTVLGDETRRFGDHNGDLHASLAVASNRFYMRALADADIGFGESYMAGEWTSPDLVALIRLMLRNMALVEESGGLVRAVNSAVRLAARRLRDNSVDGSRQHIRQHYDLGNDFFRLFLDTKHLMYSSGFYRSPHDSLEKAQENKLDQIGRKLDLSADDHVLEIGSGWGGFAVWAATRYGCRVTTTTISDAQYRHVREWVHRAGLDSRVHVMSRDYRKLTGRFDKIVSIEMFEAVGLRHYDDYFSAVDRLLAPDGSMLLQTITVTDQYFPRYHRSADWIEKYIFPGGELASVGEILASLARSTSVQMYHAENIGAHYARTLHAWRERFRARLDEVRALGFDERFIRMWDLYLAYCEAAFLERHAGDFQLLLVRNGSTRALFNEPWEIVGDDVSKAVASGF